MNELINKDVDRLVDLIIDKKIEEVQATEWYESLDNNERIEFNQKINKKMEKQRLKVAYEHKKTYEDIARRIFGKISPRASSEIYETSKCLNLELTSGVYFLRNLDNGLLKIGCGKNLLKRISQISTAFRHVGYDDKLKLEAIHLCFEPHLNLTETYFHKDFEKQRVKGEWFEISNKELEEYFFLSDFQGEFIGDVLVSFTDYESVEFGQLKKDFDIDLRQMEYEIFKELLPMVSEKFLFRTEVKNKFYQIIKAVEANKIGITAVDLGYSLKEICQVGITVKDATTNYSFSELKENKYNPKKIKVIINRIENLLSKGGQP